MKKPLYIALDMETKQEALAFLDRFAPARPAVKVGMELFYGTGPGIIQTLKERGHPVFLDLKCHDIPKTVERTMRTLASFRVDLLTIHATGGKAMMEAAKEGLMKGTPPGQTLPKCVAVTALTSTSQRQWNEELFIKGELGDGVFHFTDLALQAGLDGVVCSVREVEGLRRRFGASVYTVTPGIRMTGSDAHDQKRAATPVEAHAVGSNAIVVGRGITQSNRPLETYEKIYKEWMGE
ncbi:orotidine-5'-phosphate decarboxylase [Salicibibacter halophilus]|uniref:Orotidine 5'-phosphate decarboxylase n=1 Tax=Salicibibacter halophilus TaxID=2502791 RepID=A0A514LFF1_9BACI|nr:orotidine-5'-phosphate decarboxylase [Salicibibacter halophilus]QDI90580.1 orotidine-5'-phosphate decarboxylase [Salicibibacter halophilus]